MDSKYYIPKIQHPAQDSMNVLSLADNKSNTTDKAHLTNMKFSEEFLNSNQKDTSLGLFTDSSRKQNGIFSSIETDMALAKLEKGNQIVTYDFEAIGTPKHLRNNAKSANFFGVTEMAVQQSTYLGNGKLASNSDALAFAISLDKKTSEKMYEMIGSLEANPLNIHKLTADQKRSIADLTLYDNSAKFGKLPFNKTNLTTVLEQSGSKIGATGALSDPESIRRAREGLANLQSKGNSPSSVFSYLKDSSKGKRTVAAGHNVRGYDQEIARKMAKDVRKSAILSGDLDAIASSTWASKVFGDNQIDTMAMLGRTTSTPFSDLGQNKTLSSVYSKIFGNKTNAKAHFSGEDTNMTSRIMSWAFPKIDVEAIKKNQENSVLNGQKFVAVKGTGAYRDSDFRRNQGRYDGVYNVGKDGKYHTARNYQNGGILAGREYELLQQFDNVSLGENQTNHFGMSFRDAKTGQVHFIARETKAELGGLFDENLIPSSHPSAQSRMDNALKDRARRRYDRDFNGTSDNYTVSSVKRIRNDYNTLDEINKEVASLSKTGMKPSAATNQTAIDNVLNRLNANSSDDSLYKYSRDKLEDIATMAPRLEQERSFWDKVTNAATQTFDEKVYGETEAIQKQNLFLQQAKDRIDSELGTVSEDFTYSGMRVLPVEAKDGKMTYLNVETKKDITAQLSNKIGYGKKVGSTSLNDTREWLQGMQDSGAISAERKIFYEKEIRKQLKSNANVSPNLIEEISNEIYIGANQSKNIVAEIPGLSINSAKDGTARHQFMNNLSSNDSTFFNQVIKEAKAETDARFTRNARNGNLQNLDFFELDGISDRLKASQKTLNKFDSFFNETSTIFGQTNTNGKLNQKMKDVVSSFTAKDFDVNIQYSKNTGDVSLFFAENGSGIQNMTFDDLIASNKVGKVTMPLYDEDGLINIGNTKVTGRYKYKTGRNGRRISNVQEEAFDSLKYLPDSIRRTEETLKEKGIAYSRADIYQTKVNGYQNKITDGLISKSYAKDILQEYPAGKNSRLYNYAQGATLDISEYGDEWLKEKHPDVYQKYLKSKRNNPEISSFKDSYAVPREIKAEFQRTGRTEFSKETGVAVSTFGSSSKQAASSVYRTLDSRELFVGGTYNPTITENQIKALNYNSLDYERTKQSLISAGRSSQEAEQMLSQNLTSLAREVKGNETSHINVITAHADDLEIQQNVTRARAKINSDMSQKMNELKKLEQQATSPQNKSIISRLRGEINNLEGMRDDLKMVSKISVHDGQSILEEGLLKSLNKTQERSSKMNIYESVDEKLTKFLAGKDSVKEAIGGEFNGLQSFKLDKPLSYQELSSAGLIDKNGKITVGSLITKDVAANGGIIDVKESTTQFGLAHENWGITGYDAKSKTWLMKEDEFAKNATKILSTTGDRTTAIGVKRSVLDLIGYEGVDAIYEQVKVKKGHSGALVSEKIDFYHGQLVKDLQNGKSNNPLIGEFLEKNPKLTVQDLSRMDVQQQVIQESFLPRLKTVGLDTEYSLNQGSLNLTSTNAWNTEKLTGKNGASNFERFVNQMNADMGITDSRDLTQKAVGRHSVYDYSGFKTKATYSQKEFEILRSQYGGTKEGRRFLSLMKGQGNPSKDKYMEIGEQILATKKMGALTEDVVNSKGNIILDLTGKIAVTEEANTLMNNKGAYVVNYANPKVDLPQRKHYGSSNVITEDYFNTILDPDGIQIKGIDGKRTVGDIRRETKGSTFMKLPHDNSYVPVLDFKMSDMNPQEKANLEVIQKQQRDLYLKAKDYTDAMITTGDLSIEEIENSKFKTHNELQSMKKEYETSVNEFMTNTKKGGFQKKTQGVTFENSGSYKPSAINPYDSYTRTKGGIGEAIWENTGKYKEGTTYLSEEQMRKMIGGNEKNIAKSLEIDFDPQSKKFTTQDLQNQIIKELNMENSSEKGIYGQFGRQPSTKDSVIRTTKLQVDPSLKEANIYVGHGSMKMVSGDYDGDYGQLVLGGYSGTEQEALQAHKVQSKMYGVHKEEAISKANQILNEQEMDVLNRQSNIAVSKEKAAMAKSMNYDGILSNSEFDELLQKKGSSLDELSSKIRTGIQVDIESNTLNMKPLTVGGLTGELMESSASDFFRSKTTSIDEALSNFALTQKENIGGIDNFRARSRQMYEAIGKAGIESGSISAQDYLKQRKPVDEFLHELSQKLISSKKLTPEGMGISPNMPIEEMNSILKNRNESLIGVTQSLSNMKTADAAYEAEQKLIGLGFMKQGDDIHKNWESYAKTQIKMNVATESYGGMNSPSLTFTSGGQATGKGISDLLESNQKIIPTDAVKALGEADESVMRLFNQKEKEFKEDMSEKFFKLSDVTKTKQVQGAVQESITDVLADGAEVMTSAKNARLNALKNSPENVFKQVKSFKNSAKADSFVKGGAVFAGVWAMSALMRKAPTPEGNEARQEASQVEVNPSSLLTSPTARVKSNGEAINLKINATGNMDHNDIAGIVNNQIGMMTGVPMNVNMNVHDNTNKLDKSWYEQAVSSALGLNT